MIARLKRDIENDLRPLLAGGTIGGDGSDFDIGADEFPGTPPEPQPADGVVIY